MCMCFLEMTLRAASAIDANAVLSYSIQVPPAVYMVLGKAGPLRTQCSTITAARLYCTHSLHRGVLEQKCWLVYKKSKHMGSLSHWTKQDTEAVHSGVSGKPTHLWLKHSIMAYLRTPTNLNLEQNLNATYHEADHFTHTILKLLSAEQQHVCS